MAGSSARAERAPSPMLEGRLAMRPSGILGLNGPNLEFVAMRYFHETSHPTDLFALRERERRQQARRRKTSGPGAYSLSGRTAGRRASKV
jgi:hypothetical protein